ncbi:MAG TPA: glycosyltransferase, partial [Candidatus Eisenbacteria bacterium]
MRIVLAGFGTRGDVQPLVALGARLSAGGHDVAIAASATFAGLARDHGLGFHVVGSDAQAVVSGFGDIVRGHPLRLMRRLLEVTRDEVDRVFEHTRAAVSGADLIIAGVHPAAASAAEAIGAPYRTLLFCPQFVPSRHQAPMGIPWLELPGPCNRLLWAVTRRVFSAALLEPINRRRHDWGLPPVRDLLAHLLTERPFVASDRELGELPSDAPPGIEQTGSLALAEGGTLEPSLERFLDAGEPPVYIGFGSMPDRDPRATTRAIVESLEASGRRGVIGSGWAGLGAGAASAMVHVVHAAPHALLLPRMALAVHHGGAGTTASVARAGVPQIVVPHIADQFYWG